MADGCHQGELLSKHAARSPDSQWAYGPPNTPSWLQSTADTNYHMKSRCEVRVQAGQPGGDPARCVTVPTAVGLDPGVLRSVWGSGGIYGRFPPAKRLRAPVCRQHGVASAVGPDHMNAVQRDMTSERHHVTSGLRGDGRQTAVPGLCPRTRGQEPPIQQRYEVRRETTGSQNRERRLLPACSRQARQPQTDCAPYGDISWPPPAPDNAPYVTTNMCPSKANPWVHRCKAQRHINKMTERLYSQHPTHNMEQSAAVHPR